MSTNFLVVKDMADRYRVSAQTIRKQSKAGNMPKPFRIGNRDVWSLSELEAWESATCRR